MVIYNWIIPIPSDLAETMAVALARAGVSFQLERRETAVHVAVRRLVDYELVLSIKNFDPATEIFEGQQYVVVNTSEEKSWSADFPDKYPAEMYVMGSEPSTYGLLINAVDLLDDIAECDDGKAPEDIQVFQLIPVPLDWVEMALKLVKENDDDEG